MKHRWSHYLSLTPISISAIYAFVAVAWITFTDLLVERWVADARILTHLQTYKGWVFVAFTSAALYFLIKRHQDQIITSERKRNKSERLLRKTFENLKEAVLIIEPGTRKIIDCNRATKEIFGYNPEELIGKSTRCLHLNDARFKTFGDISEKVLKEKGVFNSEYEMSHKNGEPFYSDHSVSFVLNDEGSIEAVVSVVRDITEKKKMLEKLKESREKYRLLFRKHPEPMWIYDPDNLDFIEVNEAAVRQYGYSEDEFLSLKATDLFPPEEKERFEKENGKGIQTSPVFQSEWLLQRKDGSRINVEISASIVGYRERTVRLVLATDVSDQKRVQERIMRSMVEGEDRERERIAHGLHDGLGQYLVAARMNLESIREDIEELSERRISQYETGVSLIKQAVDETRTIAHNLMPRVLEDYGLVASIENLVEDLRQSSNIQFHFSSDPYRLSLNKRVEIDLYRIMQELLANSVRHSECHTITISISSNEDTLLCVVEDDGRGMQEEDLYERHGIGLKSINTRVKALKGSLHIETEPGKGTKTTIRIPYMQGLNL